MFRDEHAFLAGLNASAHRAGYPHRRIACADAGFAGSGAARDLLGDVRRSAAITLREPARTRRAGSRITPLERRRHGTSGPAFSTPHPGKPLFTEIRPKPPLHKL